MAHPLNPIWQALKVPQEQEQTVTSFDRCTLTTGDTYQVWIPGVKVMPHQASHFGASQSLFCTMGKTSEVRGATVCRMANNYHDFDLEVTLNTSHLGDVHPVQMYWYLSGRSKQDRVTPRTLERIHRALKNRDYMVVVSSKDQVSKRNKSTLVVKVSLDRPGRWSIHFVTLA